MLIVVANLRSKGNAMKCLINSGNNLFNRKTPLGDMTIGAFLGAFYWEGRELEELKRICQKIWEEVYVRAGFPEFMGLIRFDLVPNFIKPNGSLGEMRVSGIYEINVHSPEELAGISALEHFTGIYSLNDPSVIFANKLKKVFGKEKIVFVCGNNLLKREWGGIFFDKLRSLGVNIERMSPEEVMRNPPKILFRYGDVRDIGPNHFDLTFSKWLMSQRKSRLIFNTIPNGVDLGDKSFLLSSDDQELSKIFGENRRLLSNDDISWSIDQGHHEFLVKPNKGASGDGIYFGENYEPSEWRRILQRMLSHERYSIWQTRWLPEIFVGESSLAIDTNPVFWANNGNIEYLYTIVRADSYESYRSRGEINVAKGAGLALHTIQ